MIAIVDYGAGNIESERHDLLTAGAQPIIARDPDAVMAADRLVLLVWEPRVLPLAVS